MKVVHAQIALEVPDDATKVAAMVARLLAYGLARMGLEWKVKSYR